MRTFTLSVAVILLLPIPQDADAKPFFFGILSKLFGGGKKNNGGGNYLIKIHDAEIDRKRNVDALGFNY